MAMPHLLKNFLVFNEGRACVGEVDELKLPKLSRKMEKFRAGGMDGEVEVDLGQEALEIEQVLSGFSLESYKQYGVTSASGVMLRYAGAYQRDDTAAVQAVEVVVRGRHKEIDPGSGKSGDGGKTTVKSTLTYYKLTVDGKEVVEIDLLAFIFKVDGKDMLEAQRKAIGLA